MKRLIIPLLILICCFFSATHPGFSDENEERIDIDEMSRSFDADDELYIKENIEKFRKKEKRIITSIKFSGGNIIISPSPKKGFFYGGTFWYETVFHSPAYIVNESKESYSIDLQQRKSKIYIFPSNQRRPVWKCYIPCDIASQLDISLSGSNTLIELGGTMLERVNISAKGQETAVMFSEPSKGIIEEAFISVDVGKLSALDLLNSNTAYMKFNLSSGSYYLDFSGKADKFTERTADITLNFSKLDLNLSDKVGYEIYTSTLIHVSAPGLIRDEDYYRTPGFENSERKIYINIRGVAGKVNIIY